MFKWIKGFIVGLSICAGLVVLGIPSTAHAYQIKEDGTNMGYKVPKSLLGNWYIGKTKTKFTGRYKNYHGEHFVISNHLVTSNIYIVNKWYKVKSYVDGMYISKDGFDPGFTYTPLIFSYHGHSHKGLDFTGQNPRDEDTLYTRVKFNQTLSLNGKYGTYKVKLVHLGF